MDDGNAEILLDEIDHLEHPPARAQQIDRLRGLVLQEGPLDVRVDLLRRQLLDLVELGRHALHAEHVEAGFGEIAREQIVDLAGKIGGADEALHLEGLQRPHMVGAGGEDRHLVLLLPFPDDRRLALVAEQHEVRRALGMDEVAALLGQRREMRLVGLDGALELVGRAAADIEEERNHADPFRQHADELLERARPQRRLDAADNAAPACEGHSFPPLLFSSSSSVLRYQRRAGTAASGTTPASAQMRASSAGSGASPWKVPSVAALMPPVTSTAASRAARAPAMSVCSPSPIATMRLRSVRPSMARHSS